MAFYLTIAAIKVERFHWNGDLHYCFSVPV